MKFKSIIASVFLLSFARAHKDFIDPNEDPEDYLLNQREEVQDKEIEILSTFPKKD